MYSGLTSALYTSPAAIRKVPGIPAPVVAEPRGARPTVRGTGFHAMRALGLFATTYGPTAQRAQRFDRRHRCPAIDTHDALAQIRHVIGLPGKQEGTRRLPPYGVPAKTRRCTELGEDVAIAPARTPRLFGHTRDPVVAPDRELRVGEASTPFALSHASSLRTANTNRSTRRSIASAKYWADIRTS